MRTRNDLLSSKPDLARDIFDAFAEAKRLYLERLQAGSAEQPSAEDAVYQKVMAITGDPLPYGIEPNRTMIEALVRHSVEQGIIPRPVAVNDLFPTSTHNLIG